jgi:hypothetical protein
MNLFTYSTFPSSGLTFSAPDEKIGITSIDNSRVTEGKVMSLNPFALFDKLIVEHGSSMITKQHLEFLRNGYIILEKKVAEAKEQIRSQAEYIQSLEKQCKESQAQLAKYIEPPHGVCPYCQSPNVKLVDISMYPDFGFVMDVYDFICETCKKTWSKDVRRLQ